ncbi:MAG: EF-hand domain-containing protein, partial [archaeon]|nr:EF-hand domain-containing protein [archaeon]
MDHNGYIEYEEFIRASINKEDLVQPEYLRFAFDYFDQDRSGVISLEEVKKLFLQCEANKRSIEAQQELKEAFDNIDINKDGELNFEEFSQMMKNIISS